MIGCRVCLGFFVFHMMYIHSWYLLQSNLAQQLRSLEISEYLRLNEYKQYEEFGILERPIPRDFVLKSAIVRYGSTAGNGHYVFYHRHADGGWVCVNDSQVSRKARFHGFPVLLGYESVSAHRGGDLQKHM